jgi:hypothetical protein
MSIIYGGYQVLKDTTDVAGTPDTTLIGDIAALAVDAGKANAVDIATLHGVSRHLNATKMMLIFTHSAAADADGTTSAFELWGSADNGPRQLVCNLALTGGKGQVVAGSDLVTWVDSCTVTANYRTTGVVVDDTAGDRIVRVSVHLRGLRYWEGLFTGAGSTAVNAIAYFRTYEAAFAVG